ncbi:hypothetical protein [Pseudophaeobacter sp.]|uniref:hypothetical protein n=1 Tax=Pseudophaeobacter sp. TaxID=1971739 RepID=UPI00262A1CA1|nr:hypothetical protein [Pseudophaeobacter sp.]
MSKLAEIREAMVTMALVVERDGPVYLPLYLRLEEEEKKLMQQEAGMARALELAKGYWDSVSQPRTDHAEGSGRDSSRRR